MAAMTAIGFSIDMIEASYNLQVTLIIPTKFRVKWSFGSGEQAQKDFEDGRHFGHF